jgi:hypothetical protein
MWIRLLFISHLVAAFDIMSITTWYEGSDCQEGREVLVTGSSLLPASDCYTVHCLPDSLPNGPNMSYSGTCVSPKTLAPPFPKYKYFASFESSCSEIRTSGAFYVDQTGSVFRFQWKWSDHFLQFQHFCYDHGLVKFRL